MPYLVLLLVLLGRLAAVLQQLELFLAGLDHVEEHLRGAYSSTHQNTSR